jgi:surface protein
MATNNNLQDFLTDVANAIRTKTGATQPINAQDFSAKILNIPTGGGNTLKNLLDATQSASYLFISYKGTSVDDLIQPNDTSNVTNMSYMFNNCSSLTTIPQLDTSNVTDMYYMFHNCNSLTSIPLLDTSNVTNMNGIFSGCSSLKSILMTGMKVKFDISASTKFERADLLIILNNLATVTTTQTLTMGATNLAKLTDEDKAIATNKGWTLA